jgi:hypothetical protein
VDAQTSETGDGAVPGQTVTLKRIGDHIAERIRYRLRKAALVPAANLSTMC